MLEHLANSFCHGSKDISPLNFTPMEFASVPDQYSLLKRSVQSVIEYKDPKAHGQGIFLIDCSNPTLVSFVPHYH